MKSRLFDNGFVAVDWGTTNRRIFVLSADGNVVRREADGRGILSVEPNGFSAEIASLRRRFGDCPFILAGMIGSSRGWLETAYLSCPVSVDEIADGLLWVEAGRTAIVPGVAAHDDSAMDVMRGEETQLFGASLNFEKSDEEQIICQPGTHSKWVKMAGDSIAEFRTFLTGELFGLLRRGSILSAHMIGDVDVNDAFADGVQTSVRHPEQLTANLFGARARVLLNAIDVVDFASYVSGLLIGAEVASSKMMYNPKYVNLVGEPELIRLYCAALGEVGIRSARMDGEKAFLSGIISIKERIR